MIKNVVQVCQSMSNDLVEKYDVAHELPRFLEINILIVLCHNKRFCDEDAE